MNKNDRKGPYDLQLQKNVQNVLDFAVKQADKTFQQLHSSENSNTVLDIE